MKITRTTLFITPLEIFDLENSESPTAFRILARVNRFIDSDKGKIVLSLPNPGMLDDSPARFDTAEGGDDE